MQNIKYYPSRETLNTIVQNICIGGKLEPAELDDVIQSSRNWETQILILSYFISKVLEKYKKSNSQENCQKLLSQIYDIENHMFAKYECLDREFTEYVLSHQRMENSLEDNIMFLLEKYNDHNYEFIVRH